MAYGLKYSQYLEKGGSTLQIRVYVDGYSGASYGMAHLTGAALQIVGGQSDILTPFIKTSFSWSMADCWDEGTTKSDGTTCVNAQNEKCGEWEEFYTPDATKFRVELWAKATPSATAACIWTGYVTPDSWSENMTYRGSVTVTARDMLGALRDKEFDLTGRVSVLDIVQGALSAASCPMSLSYTAGHFLVNEDGSNILSHTIAASTFSGDTWQEALEETLESLGLVLRYNGANAMVLTSLRYLKADTTSGSHTIEFISNSGLRELDPALRSITETFDVEMVAYNAPDPEETQFARTGGTITCSMTNVRPNHQSETATGQLYAYTLTRANNEGWAGTLGIPLYGTIGSGIPSRGIYFPTNVQDTQNTLYADYTNPRVNKSFKFRLLQDGSLIKATNGASASASFEVYNGVAIILSEINVRVEATASGTTYYLNQQGAWVTELSYITVAPGEEVEVPTLNNGSGYKVVVKSLRTAGATDNVRPVAPLLAALLLEIAPNYDSTSPTEFKTTTIYNEDNNVTITRKPTIGSATINECIEFYENVLGLGNVLSADKWNWPGESSYYPLAVMIQAQALCYHAAAASVFTGTAHDKNTGAALALPGCAYTYYSRGCVAVSGTYDFASGFFAQSNFREVYSWEDVWGASFAPQYTRTQGAGRGSTSATGAGGTSITPGGSSGGSGGVASQNYWEVDPDYDGIKLKDAYDGIRIPGIRFGDGVSDLDLYVETVQDTGGNPIRVLRTPLAFVSDGDQIVGDGTPGGGGGGGGQNYLRDLYDVSLTNLTTGQMLQWNGSAWVNVAAPSGGGGTVTSVALTVPTGLSVSGSPITTSGTLAISFATGYSIPTTAKQGNWDTAYGWGDHAQAGYLLASTAASTYQPLDADLTAIAGLTGTSGLLKKTAANTWALDTNTYLTAHQTIYALTLEVGTSTVGTYTPNSAAQTLTISAQNLYDTIGATKYHKYRGDDALNTFKIGGATLTWVVGTGGAPSYLQIDAPLVTDGDQIVGGGTPGGGGSGSSFLKDLLDVYGHDASPSRVKRADGSNVNAGDALVYYDTTKGWVASAGGFLPLTGGTLQSAAVNIFNIDNNASGAQNNYQYFKLNGTAKAGVGYYSGIAFLANETSHGRIGIDDSGTPQYWSSASSSTAKTIWHEGNFVDGTNYISPKTTLSGYGITDWLIQSTSTAIDSLTTSGIYRLSTQTTPYSNYGNLLVIRGTSASDTLAQMYFPYNADAIYFRRGTTNNFTSNTWRQLYHTGNANKSDVAWTCSTLTSSVATGTAPFTVSSTTMVDNLNANYLAGWSQQAYVPAYLYSAANGYLVKTSLNVNTRHIYVKIEGTAYNYSPIFSQASFYTNQTADTNTAFAYPIVIHYGATKINNLQAFFYGGLLYIWFQQPRTYCGMKVTVWAHGAAANYVTEITNAAIPSSGVTCLTTFTEAQNAFTSSNVASATKLETARTLWGQSFDGTANVDGLITVSGIGGRAIVQTKGTNTVFSLGSASSGTTAGTENAILQLFHNGTEMVRLYANSSNPSWINAGNVGIGTASPGAKLHVVGSSFFAEANAGDFVIHRTAAGSAILDLAGNNQTTNVWRIAGADPSQGAFKIIDRRGTTENARITIDTSGNVGIGTASPGYPLQVTGTIYSNGGVMRVDSGYSFTALYNGYSYDLAGIDASGNNMFGRGSSSQGIRPTQFFGNSFKFFNSNVTQLAVIDNNGNVGIGTASPGYKLDVATTTYDVAAFRRTSVGDFKIQINNNGAQLYHVASGSSTSTYIDIKDGYGVGINTMAPAYTFHVQGASAALINPSGAVYQRIESQVNSWSYLRLVSGASQATMWDIATINSTSSAIVQAGAFEIRDSNDSQSGISIRHASSSYGKLVVRVPSGECSIGFWSTDNNYSGYPRWTMGYTADANNTFGWYSRDAASGWRMTLTPAGNLTVEGDYIGKRLVLNRASGAGYGRISFYSAGYYTWYMYMNSVSTAAGYASPTGAADPAGSVVTKWAIRSLIENATGYGWAWESCTNAANATPVIQMELSSATGTLVTRGDQVISSDATLKENLQDVTYTIADIAKTRAVTFDWKDGRGHSAGSIAQDWKPLIPELVHGEEGNMTLAYGQIALLNSILLARRSESHEERIKALEARVAELELENEQLRAN